MGLFFYNMPYKLVIKDRMMTVFLDSFINASYITFVLLANLTISDFLGRQGDNLEIVKAFIPKLVVCLLVWVGFYGYIFSDALEYLIYALRDNEILPDADMTKYNEVSIYMMTKLSFSNFTTWQSFCISFWPSITVKEPVD